MPHPLLDRCALFSRKLTALACAFLACICIGLVTPASAQGLDALNAPSPAASAQEIPTNTDVTSDRAITARISGIFGEIAALKNVKAQVSAGVVTLEGTVPTASDSTRAEAIAARVAGVVTVQNRIEQRFDVDSNLSPAFDQIRRDVRGLVHALPLAGVALATGLLIALLGHGIASLQRFWCWLIPNVFLAELIGTFIRFGFIVVGLVVCLDIMGSTALLGAVLGGAGVLGIALGFAVRDTVDNYVSSLMLSLRQPFRANDHVDIEGREGRVVRLTSRATILMTMDGNHLRIPNSTVFKAVILNFTRNPERRFEFDLGIDASDDAMEGMAIGLEALANLPFVLKTPKASAVIQNVGDSNIVLRFYGWLDQTHTDFLKGRSLALHAAKVALEAAGFVLPEPIYRLRFDEAAPLQFKQLEQPRPKAAPEPRTREITADTAPDKDISRLVAEERSVARSDDLLDSRNPTE